MLPGDWVVLGLLAAAGLYRGVLAATLRARLEARREGARRRHEAALRLLEEHGFRLLDVPAAVDVRTRLDGRGRVRRVRGDLLVERGGRRYVARLRGGRGERLADGAARGRLLDLVLAYRPDGVVWVEAGRARLRVVDFEVGSRPALARWAAAARPLWAFVLGVALAWGWARLRGH